MIDPQDRYNELKNKLIQIAHLNEKKFGSRATPYPAMNCLIWQEMRNEGYFSREIAEAAGRKHSTIITQTNKLKDVIQERNQSWRSILHIWDRLQDELENEKMSKEVIEPEVKMKLDKERLVNRILTLPKEDRMDIILAVQDSMSMTEINDKWETSTTIDQ